MASASEQPNTEPIEAPVGSEPVPSGLVLGGRYALTERIARGGMGEVWTARDVVLGRTVAVKILKPELLESTEFVERFRAEARHAAALTHPGIATVYDYGEDDESGAYLVMEFVAGEPLSALLGRTSPLPLTRALAILAETARALAAAHAGGVIHRDVKPGNLMILPDGSVKVTDFGIARAIDAAPLTQTGHVVGTPQYMSPEQASGRSVTPSTDIYSLAVVGYEMLAGARPFTGENAMAVALAQVNEAPPPLPASVPAAVRSLIERALSKQPEQRPASATDFAASLTSLLVSHTPAPSAVASPGGVPASTPTVIDAEPATAIAGLPGVPLAGRGGRVVVGGSAVAHRSRRSRALVIATIVAAVAFAGFVLARRDDGFAPAAGTSTTLVQPIDAASPVVVDAAVATVASVPVDTVAPTVAPPPTEPAPVPVFVDPAAHIGRPVDEVVAALEALGLVVDVETVKGDKRSAGLVAGVEPNGDVAPQSAVTVSVVRGKGNDDDDD